MASTKQQITFLGAKAHNYPQVLVLDDISGLILTQLSVSSLLLLANRGPETHTFPSYVHSAKDPLEAL